MAEPVLRIAVVGHTNTGKTSLMRTLMRDGSFGEVSDRPATTRHVEGAALLIEGRPAIELYDTPGLEDSPGLLDLLESYRGDARADRPALIERFLADAAAQERFGQEGKAIRQVIASDVALYVVDVRDPVLGKHRDELEILSWCAWPVVPVLNFTSSPEARIALWREHLARAGLHAAAEFDTVVLNEDSERRLFEKLRSLLDSHHQTLTRLIEDRRKLRDSLVRASAELVADMLIDAAALAISVREHDRRSMDEAGARLREAVRGREQACVDQLLRLHRFRPDDVDSADLPTVDGRWALDLFSPEAMKQFGIQAGRGAAAGAVAGLVIDVAVGGLSLGAAAAAGAALGAMIEAGRARAGRLVRFAAGQRELRCDDATIRLLGARQIELVRALLRRGHASQLPLRMAAGEKTGDGRVHVESGSRAGAASGGRAGMVPGTRGGFTLRPPRLPTELAAARLSPRWSRLGTQTEDAALSKTRRAAVMRLAQRIEAAILGGTAGKAFP